jgi:predicted GTPase
MESNKRIQPAERENQTHLLIETKLAAIFEELHNRGDFKSARKVAELLNKFLSEELTIAFCGHFSAGKSSFINEILEESILPASPIPTSANVVQIRKGEELAHVHFFEGEALEILPPVSFEHVKAYCKNGDQVESVAYQYPFRNLPEDLIVLDTPGVDSTDDAHRISTESALHLADVIFYVMDYNHVQSEVNLKFIKELQDKEKRIYLIINQIDKHREEEISFETYHKRIQESFADWGIEPASLYFTSLKNADLPLNDLKIVKETIQILRQDKMEILPRTMEKALQHVLDEHKKWLEDQKEEEVLRLQQIARNVKASAKEVTIELEAKKKLLETLDAETKRKKETFISQMKQILENANITPFEMRELAEKYLESQQKGYKVGLLFTSKKTNEEKEARRLQFQQDTAERVKTQVEKFIHEHIIHFLKEQDLYTPAIFDKVQAITVQMTDEYIAGHVKSGAGYTGNAVLHYTKDLASSIKRDYQKQVLLFMEPIFASLDRQHGARTNALQDGVRNLEEVHQAYESIRSIQIELERSFDELITILYKHDMKQVSVHTAGPHISLYVNRSYKQVSGDELPSSKSKRVNEEKMPVKIISEDIGEHQDPKTAADKLLKVSQLVETTQGFQTIVEDLKNRAEKLADQSFTVALFGAFSAGKSSLANALFGEKILPVSPNPTTASINKISPVTAERPHGTVCVQMKSEEQLLEDVKQGLSHFNSTIANLSDGQEIIRGIIEKNKHLELDASKKPHFHFLKAFLKGWEDMHRDLGYLKTVSFNEFEAYVAEEEKSCFVEWIEVFYDCGFTRQGLTLVDTPGADSINARHTDVSFDYIKNADAILFVTYYQHAFSKADREFLIQLGRVKDAFSLDKMFFLVNAADLANNEEELVLVCDYVEEQLTAYGIRHPRLFPVSSLLALKEKEGKEFRHSFLKSSLISEFEKEFSDFIHSDLINMSIHTSQLDINRAVDLYANYVNQAKLGSDQKEALRRKYAENHLTIQQYVADYATASFYTLLEQEINELLYYVKQRTLLRFSDFFKESFNPAVLREDGRNIKLQLNQCLNEFVSDIFRNLSQEVRATTVRAENFIKKLLADWQKEIEEHAKKIEAQVSIRLYDFGTLEALRLSTSFPVIPAKMEKQTVGLFRNSKSFFEKNEKQKMLQYLEEQISPLMDQYLEESDNELTNHYKLEFEQTFNKVKQYLERQIADYFEGMEAALSEEVDLVELEKINKELQNYSV